MGYRRYRNFRHRRNNGPGPLGALIGLVFIGAFLLGRFFFGLIAKALRNKSRTQSSFRVSDRYTDIRKSYIATQESTLSTSLAQTNPQTHGGQENRYSLRPTLLTPAEKVFLNALEQAVGNHYRIENQVPLSRIVVPRDSNENFTNYHDFNRIKAKSIDFVLYDQNYTPYLCIELDDRSHLQWDRIKRDAFVDELMRDVGLRIIHIPVRYSYDLSILRQQIFQSVSQNT